MAKSKKKTDGSSWGGPWTEQKLDCFESYVKAYLTIMNSHRDKYNWKLIYFDGFAGCGSRSFDNCEDENSKDELMELFESENCADTKKELNVYAGAAERVIRLEQSMRGFDFYYFVDTNENNLTKLDLKLAQYELKGTRVFRHDNANHQATMLADAMAKNPKLKTLCFLDPFGMNINWESIQQLAGKSIDLWILVPIGTIVNRLVKTDGTLMYPERLESFFGLHRNEIQKRMQVVETEQTLFGEERKIHKVNDAISKLANLYCEQLGTLFDFVTNEPLVLYNSNHLPIFHFVCASNNKTAIRIAKQIIDKRQA